MDRGIAVAEIDRRRAAPSGIIEDIDAIDVRAGRLGCVFQRTGKHGSADEPVSVLGFSAYDIVDVVRLAGGRRSLAPLAGRRVMLEQVGNDDVHGAGHVVAARRVRLDGDIQSLTGADFREVQTGLRKHPGSGVAGLEVVDHQRLAPIVVEFVGVRFLAPDNPFHVLHAGLANVPLQRSDRRGDGARQLDAPVVRTIARTDLEGQVARNRIEVEYIRTLQDVLLERVGAPAIGKTVYVVAFAADQGIVAGEAFQRVVTKSAGQLLVGRVAGDLVRFLTSGDILDVDQTVSDAGGRGRCDTGWACGPLRVAQIDGYF